jgi:uncharacterized repeat protein (TIGR01451 family)
MRLQHASRPAASPSRRSWTAFVTFLVALATATLLAAAPAGAATTVPACEGTTEYALTPGLLELTGTREAELNSGASVPLYLTDGRIATPDFDPLNSGKPPGCVAYRDGGGTIKSVWAYCTDHGDSSCMATWLPSPTTVTGNPKFLPSADSLGPDKEKVIGYLVQHGYPVRNGAAFSTFNYPGGFPDVTDANQDSTRQRAALQEIVWCVSDAGPGNKVKTWAGCAANFTAADFDAVLALADGSPVLQVTAPVGPLTVGDVARFTVETNITDKPLQLTFTGGDDWRVCAGDAVLSGNALTVASTGVWGQTATVELCATTAAEGTVKLHASGLPDPKEDLVWLWNGSDACQIFATTTRGKDWWVHVADDQVTVQAPVVPTEPTEPTEPTTPTTPTAPTTPTTPTAPTTPVVAVSQVERISTLRVTKTSAKSRYRPGQRITYRIRVTNPSSTAARNVRVCDTMPRGLVFVSASPKARLSNGQHCWTVKTLGAKKSASFRIVARVAGSAPSRVTNRVTASSRDVRRTATAKRTVRIQRAVAKAGGVTG